MGTTIVHFEPMCYEERRFGAAYVLVFNPSDIQLRRDEDMYFAANVNCFDIIVSPTFNILNQRQLIALKDLSHIPSKKSTRIISLAQFAKETNLLPRIQQFIEERLQGTYSFSAEMKVMFSVMEAANKQRLIDKSLLERDESLFYQLTGSKQR